jgi:hypothetical protein
VIAAELNGDGLLTARGKQWTSATIGKLLQNETYCGNIMSNRSSYKLSKSSCSTLQKCGYEAIGFRTLRDARKATIEQFARRLDSALRLS